MENVREKSFSFSERKGILISKGDAIDIKNIIERLSKEKPFKQRKPQLKIMNYGQIKKLHPAF